MSQEKIEKLTPEQEALIPVYREKWRDIAYSTEPIDREKAAKAVKAVYILIELSEPEILFYDSPYAVGSDKQLVIDKNRIYGELYETRRIFNQDFSDYLLSAIKSSFCNTVMSRLGSELHNDISWKLEGLLTEELIMFFQTMEQVRNQLWEEIEFKEKQIQKLCEEMWVQLDIPIPNNLVDRLILQDLLIGSETNHQLANRISQETDNLSQQENLLNIIFGNDDIYIEPAQWVSSGSLYDFCINVLNFEYKQKEWEAFQTIAKNCGCIFPYEKMVIVCDRPRILSLDNQQRLHAEGAPAIQFADGYSLYVYHGVRLPEKYGKLHPTQWEAKWIIEEDNAELRRVLIQGIGYDRIAQELGAIELDSYQEYTLFKIDTDIDVEPISLLKMTCPSTGFIHVLRVPPEMISAREAIAWVNWGIKPEEFSVQT
ncbi:DUF6745 domain-containing protein [Coleofasciculus sp. FACHB-SPT9]|uniref:DUF6745 domain-containing protein n=1 Tax=Cyanophyceae TaxID=3028117 RepID=UPI0016821205|nr:hypothetical protein [Coleofasciculus sp. FACHB-SPT9]MBD1890873.1 hypothetical protein [Coleofasciculus sp. FACHB-SPT9]